VIICLFFHLRALRRVIKAVEMIRIAVVNVPIPAPWLGDGVWITVPPQGYGGIQWVVAHLVEGLLDLGHRVLLLGAPGSISRKGLEVVDEAGTPAEIRNWLIANTNSFDLVHDNSNGEVFDQQYGATAPYLATYHLTGTPTMPTNVVYLSRAQRSAAGIAMAPVIPIPVATSQYQTVHEKENYLLFLGRVSPWKGVLEASEFARTVGLRLRIAGPTWDEDYRRQVEAVYPSGIEWMGEVGGSDRLRLLARARAVLVLSQSVPGPWGHLWVEPGATVVSEAAASGTPVVASRNGCLPELVPGVGVILEERGWDAEECRSAIVSLPSSAAVRAVAKARWSHTKVAQEYVDLYRRTIGGERW
jgi:glycosyltransferase involved in cell wall biosynthesis